MVNNRPGNEIYFIGLIDLLTTFDLKKKAEHVLKSVKNLNNVHTYIHTYTHTLSLDSFFLKLDLFYSLWIANNW
jgi:hypothetical protein